MTKLNTVVKEYYLNATFVISLVATSGSLYFSEVMELVPCTLCWYQRILMYPLVILSAVGIITGDSRAYKYVLSLAIPGAIIAAYHYYLQLTGLDTSFASCSVATPCNEVKWEYFGFVTIPFLSLVAFLLIIVVNAYAYYLWRKAAK